jgi:L-lactate dehydrogenase complex protein LldG
MNYNEIIALRKAFKSVRERQKNRVIPDFNNKRNKLRSVREFSVGNEDLLKKAVRRVEENGIKVFIAKTSADAIKIVLHEIGDEKLVVKSKSNVTKEIMLSDELTDKGIKVIETDIGDRIMQILKCKPSHPTGPVAHLSAKDISEGLSKYYDKKISEDPAEIVNFIRKEIKDYIEKAEVGITGANAITAEEGSIVLVHNEGNIFEVFRKKKHIVITGIDKIYPAIEDAINMLKIISFNATGSLIPSFVEILSGMSKTADVEKKFYKGVHSPHDVILILLDNKRTEIIEKGYKELLYCIDCGNCLLHCPMYNTIGTDFAEGKNLGGKGLAYQSISSDEINKKLEFCLTCGRCKKNCPLSIDVPVAIRKIRSDSFIQESYYFLKSHLFWLYQNLQIRLK